MELIQPTATSTRLDEFSPFGYSGVSSPFDPYTTGLTVLWSAARRLLSSYSGNLIRVRRTDGTLDDFGFDGSGNLDSAALLTFCGGTDGFIHTLYDQSGGGFNMVQATDAEQIRIVNAGSLEVIGTNNRAAGAATANLTGGYTHASTFADYAGTQLTSTFVTGVTSSQTAAFALGFAKDAGGATIFGAGRVGRNSTNEQLIAVRQVTTIATVAMTYGETKAVGMRYSGTDGYLIRAGVEATGATTLAWDINRVIIGGASTAVQSMGSGDTHAEGALWLSDIGASALSAIMAEQETYYGL